MCDCLVALAPRSASGRTLFAKNSDRPPGEAQRIEWIAPRRDRRPIHATHIEVAPHPSETIGALISRPWWMWGAEHGVNEAGLAIGNETIYTRLDPRQFPPALTGMDLVRLALERSATAKDAVATIVELIDRYGQGGSGHHGADRPYWSSFLIADPHDAWVVETSGREVATEQVRATRAISNRTTIPAFDAHHRHPRQPVERLVDPRLAASNALLASEDPITAAQLQDHLRSHVGGEGGWTVCMHVPDVEATTASLVADLPDLATGDRPRARVLLGSPCASVYLPLFVGRPIGTPVEWARFAALDASQRARLDELERSLEADATDDDGWADEAWARVAKVLDA